MAYVLVVLKREKGKPLKAMPLSYTVLQSAAEPGQRAGRASQSATMSKAGIGF